MFEAHHIVVALGVPPISFRGVISRRKIFEGEVRRGLSKEMIFDQRPRGIRK
jgi:hypothetical protein